MKNHEKKKQQQKKKIQDNENRKHLNHNTINMI